MKARIKWTEGAQFVGSSDSGHPVVIDGPVDGGGKNLGLRPMELVLLGTGGCTAYDVVDILRKSRQPVQDCVVEIEADRAEQPPKVFTRIHIRFIVTGKGLGEAAVKRAVDLSAEKYCSASIMLRRAGVEITHDYRIVEGA
ncbi:MAG: OsmC family protein [Gammaproteobacteria bacterium]|nr:OsmC family protein [Gammaproteobacteria bacterium]